MNELYTWANRYNITTDALKELIELIEPTTCITDNTQLQTELDLQNRIRLDFMDTGGRLWRNNVGAFYDKKRIVRYGLANESKKINSTLKSADLIGIKPILITDAHVGKIIGQFVSREIKNPCVRINKTKRLDAQKNWALLIQLFGGDAKIVNSDNEND